MFVCCPFPPLCPASSDECWLLTKRVRTIYFSNCPSYVLGLQMLEVGNLQPLTQQGFIESRTHFGAWCVVSSPLGVHSRCPRPHRLTVQLPLPLLPPPPPPPPLLLPRPLLLPLPVDDKT